jgi:hypothetical protein
MYFWRSLIHKRPLYALGMVHFLSSFVLSLLMDDHPYLTDGEILHRLHYEFADFTCDGFTLDSFPSIDVLRSAPRPLPGKEDSTLYVCDASGNPLQITLLLKYWGGRDEESGPYLSMLHNRTVRVS